MVIGVIKNPARKGSISGAGVIHGVIGKPIDVEIVFPMPAKDVRNLRTGKKLAAGKTIRAKWNPSEALLFEVMMVSG